MIHRVMFQKILIIGGCGYLGQYLINDLLNEFPDSKIKVLDLKPNPNPSLFNFKNIPNLEIFPGKDTCDYDLIKNDIKNCDIIINLAAFISFSLKDKKLLERVNVQGTKNILKAMSFNGITRLIHISSASALGYVDDKNTTVNETFNFDWNIAKKKRKYYMLAKHAADNEIESCIKRGLNAVILYPGTMFGPGNLTNSSRLIRAIKYGKIPFNTPGGTNVVDVRDVTRGISMVLKRGITNGKFLLSGFNLTFKEINKIIADELSVKPPRLALPRIFNRLLFYPFLFIESIAKSKLELTTYNFDSAFKFRYFDNKKAREEFGWEPKISFKQSIKDTINWMDKNGYV